MNYFYQWQWNSNNLSDNGRHHRFPGSATLSVADATQAALGGAYDVIVSNLNPSSVTSAPVTIAFIPEITLSGNGPGASWTSKGNPGVTTLPLFNYNGMSNAAELTQGILDQEDSSILPIPGLRGRLPRQRGRIKSSTFTARTSWPTARPFVVQNDARGTAVLGAAGGGFGYSGITNSFARADVPTYSPTKPRLSLRHQRRQWHPGSLRCRSRWAAAIRSTLRSSIPTARRRSRWWTL